jgi:hypothetical protein
VSDERQANLGVERVSQKHRPTLASSPTHPLTHRALRSDATETATLHRRNKICAQFAHDSAHGCIVCVQHSATVSATTASAVGTCDPVSRLTARQTAHFTARRVDCATDRRKPWCLRASTPPHLPLLPPPLRFSSRLSVDIKNIYSDVEVARRCVKKKKRASVIFTCVAVWPRSDSHLPFSLFSLVGTTDNEENKKKKNNPPFTLSCGRRSVTSGSTARGRSASQ